MAFKLVKTGKSYKDQRDTPLSRHGNSESSSLPEGYRLKHPDAQVTRQELEKIVERVHSEGCVLLWSTTLSDLVAFYRDEDAKGKIPPGFVPYSEAELKELFGEGKARLSPATLKLIHEAKKHGGRVTGKGNDSLFPKE